MWKLVKRYGDTEIVKAQWYMKICPEQIQKDLFSILSSFSYKPECMR